MRHSLFCITLGLLLASILPTLLHADEKALVEAGVPAISREWNGEDYTKVAGLFSTGKVPLPRYSDDQGRMFLQRLTAVENLSFCSDEKLPMDSRINDFLNVVSGASSILGQYVTAINKGTNTHAECAQMMAFTLRTAAVGVHLMNEMIPTFPKDDKYPVRMEGVRKTKNGLIGVFSGAEVSLSEKEVYDARDFSVLLDAMAETLPTLKTAFADGYKLELRQKLEADKPSFTQAKDAEDIRKMLGELEK